MGLLKEANVDR